MIYTFSYNNLLLLAIIISLSHHSQRRRLIMIQKNLLPQPRSGVDAHQLPREVILENLVLVWWLRISMRYVSTRKWVLYKDQCLLNLVSIWSWLQVVPEKSKENNRFKATSLTSIGLARYVYVYWGISQQSGDMTNSNDEDDVKEREGQHNIATRESIIYWYQKCTKGHKIESFVKVITLVYYWLVLIAQTLNDMISKMKL